MKARNPGRLRMTPAHEPTPGVAAYSARYLATLPTLCVGQAEDLKIDDGRNRVWLSRCGVDDGEPCDNKVSVERLVNGRWENALEYFGGDT